MSFAATIPELATFPAYVISKCAAGLAMAEYGADYGSTHTAAERAELLLEYPEFVIWADKLFSSRNGERTTDRKWARHIQRIGVIAAMVLTWRKSQRGSTDFWTAVRDETGTTPLMPDRVLAKYLTTTSVNTGGGSRDKVKLADAREMMVKSLHSWNAWRRDETTKLSYYADKPIPAAV